MATVETDLRFDERFAGRLKQVFLYLTDECNTRCVHCYYKPWLKDHHGEMPTEVVQALLQKFRSLGATKVSLLGGEPTQYGQAPGNERLGRIVTLARQIGYTYIRIVTNGLFDDSLLCDPELRRIDEITFSVDGDTPEVHNSLRGTNAFQRVIRSLRHAVSLGYRVHMTMCVHRGNIGLTATGEPLLVRAIRWAASLGVHSFNFHPLLRMGVARDGWTGETDIEPEQWIQAYRLIQSLTQQGHFGITVRIPIRFVSSLQLSNHPQYYGYCSVRSADRLDVHPNGTMHTCALHTGTSTAVATFRHLDNRVRIQWEERDGELDQGPLMTAGVHPCHVIKRTPDGLTPLCISLKTSQEDRIEFVN